MAKKQGSRVRMAIVVFFSACALMLFAACQGVSSSGGALNVSGKVLSVNTAAHTVTVQGNLNGQQQTFTIGGLTDQQIADLQSHINGSYGFQVTQNNNTYSISSDPVSQDQTTPGNTTPQATTGTTQQTSVQGTISFIGKIQSITSNSAVVSMPNGSTLSMSLTQNTDRGDVNVPLNTGTQVKVKAITNLDGSFQASSLKTLDNDHPQQNNDLNTVSFQGVTTNTVGSDNVLHFKVGSQVFTAQINNNTELKNLNNPQAINNNQPIKVDILYNGNNGSAVKVEASDNN